MELKEEPLKQLVEIGQKSLLKIQNIVAEKGPIEFEDVKKMVDMPHSTIFKALKSLVEMGTIAEVRKEKNTATGIKNVSYYSTPYKVKLVLLEKQEILPRLKIEAFDIALFGSSFVVFGMVMLKMLREAIGAVFGLVTILIYWLYFRIIKRGGRWVEIK